MLPRVKIDFRNGQLGSVAPNNDSVVGLAITATGVSDKFALLHPYVLHSIYDLENLGITNKPDDANAFVYKHVKEFYNEAGEGATLWIIGFPNTTTASSIVDKDSSASAKRLLETALGEIRCLVVAVNPATSYTPTIENGLDKDLESAMLNAQVLSEWATDSLFAPVFVLLEARHYNGSVTDLPNLTTYDYNRVGVLLGDTVENSNGASVGLLGGRIAKIPVQRHIGRVKDGALNTLTTFIGDKKTEFADAETINDKGFITFRTFVGKAGYFFSDDSLAAKASDDYRSIARRRTIDKAYRIAYRRLLEELNDEVPITDEGKLAPAMVKGWQMQVETAIINEMTAEGNLGIDPTDENDTGVQCYIDFNQNVVATGRIEVVLRVKPYGYAKYIDVKLGFKTTNV